MNSIARGTLINLSTRILAIALGLSVVLVTARLGPQVQGAFALFAAVESALLMLCSGFGVALARRVSHYGEQPAELVGAVVLASIVAGIACALVLFGIAGQGRNDVRFLAVLACAAPLLFVTPSLSGLWLGHARMVALARINLSAPLFTLIGMGLTLVLRGHVGLFDVLWSWVIARLLVALATLFVVVRKSWIGRPDMGRLSAEWRFVVVIGLTNLVGLLNYKADLFLVEHYLGRKSTGVYSMAVMVAELLWLVSSSVTLAAYARIGTPEGADASRITLRVIHVSVIALALLAPIVWLAAAWLLPLVVGVEYAASISVLAWLLPGVLAYGAASALSAYFTNHVGRPLIPAALATLSLLINIVLSILLIPRLGMVGGAVATTVSYFVSIGVSVGVFCRHSGTPLHRLLQPQWRLLAADMRKRSTRCQAA